MLVTIPFRSIAFPLSFVFPETSRSNYNPNGVSVKQQSEIISNRPTSNFNRLPNTRISHSLQNDAVPDYLNYDDEPEKLTNTLLPNGQTQIATESTEENRDSITFGDTQGRHFIHVKHKKKKKPIKKRPCIPQAHNGPKYSRTYPNLNLVFVDVNYNGNSEYNTNGGYACRPGNFGSSGLGSHIGGLFTHGSHGVSAEEDYDENVVAVDSGHNSHGALLGVGGGGSVGGSGGPLGFFGQGGLFDFSSSNSGTTSSNVVRPQVDDSYDSIDENGVRPVIEINVPDTIQDAVSNSTISSDNNK